MDQLAAEREDLTQAITLLSQALKDVAVSSAPTATW